ncbi:hypothetical protein [Methylobacterium sp. SI9]|uniref:hypothetical protein n=1 Tax=Methylobacterium guangdongense TaxID=3138811 RepID=UPI00313C80B6
MMDLSDLPLFSGVTAVEAERKPKRPRSPLAPPSPRLIKSGSRIVALPLARDRRLVADLVAMFRAVPPGPQRAAAFRRDVLTPLVSPRLALGLTPDQIEAELNALEEAMVGQMLAGQLRAGRRG